MKPLRWPRPGSARRATPLTFRSFAERTRAIPIVVVLAAGAAFAPPARANPVPQHIWDEWLRLPGRYLRTPSDTTRRRLVRLLGDGELNALLQTPDTVTLMIDHLETFVPLLVEAQSPPFMPDAETQAWFRSVAPGRRAEMIEGLARWLAPGLDSLAPYHGAYFSRPSTRGACTLMYARNGAAQRLADWDARETLPAMRAMRRRLSAECVCLAEDTLTLFRPLDDAIRRLEGGPSLAPLTPDGHGGVRSRFTGAWIRSATRYDEGSHSRSPLSPSTRASLWSLVVAARETAFVAGGSDDVDFKFYGEGPIQLRIGPDWGIVTVDQYPYPHICLRDERLYLRALELAGAGWLPRSTIRAIGNRARFRSEHVVVTIGFGTVQVDGQYDFETDGTGRPFAVRFPPVGSKGDPPFRYWTASVESPPYGSTLAPRQLGRDSIFVLFPGSSQRMVRVRATSTEPLHGRQRVVYLLTTARAWGEPLERAELEVDWPDRLGTPHFSLPMKRAAHAGLVTRYRFHAAPFMPDTDLVVTWGH